MLLSLKIRPYLLQHVGTLATSDRPWMAAQRPENGFIWAFLWGVRPKRLIHMSVPKSSNTRFHSAPLPGAASFYPFSTLARCEAACKSTSRGPAKRQTRIWYHGGKIDHEDILRGPGDKLCVIWKDSFKTLFVENFKKFRSNSLIIYYVIYYFYKIFLQLFFQ